MKKTALLVWLLLIANSALAEPKMLFGNTAAAVIKEGDILATELDSGKWHILVIYDDMLFACHVFLDNATCWSGGA